jgi:hypothetical protein
MTPQARSGTPPEGKRNAASRTTNFATTPWVPHPFPSFGNGGIHKSQPAKVSCDPDDALHFACFANDGIETYIRKRLSIPSAQNFPATHSPHTQFSSRNLACFPYPICQTGSKGTCCLKESSAPGPQSSAKSGTESRRLRPEAEAEPSSSQLTTFFPRFWPQNLWNQDFARYRNRKSLNREILGKRPGGGVRTS